MRDTALEGGGGPAETYYAESGTLTIDSSTDAKVEGTLQFAAETPAGVAVSVSGSFRADDLLDE